MQSTSTAAKQLPHTAKIEGRIFGVDEAGRGAMAGPLSVAAVEFPWPGFELFAKKVKDSKRMSPKARAEVAALIMAHCKYAVAMIPALWIDQHGIQAAETEGMFRVVNELAGWDRSQFDPQYPDLIICDGTPDTWGMGAHAPETMLEPRLHYMIKGDSHVPAISAASIVAKWTRDNYMETEVHQAYPTYRFDLHVGYVTPLHLAKLDEYGSCDIHRHTFRPVRERDANDL